MDKSAKLNAKLEVGVSLFTAIRARSIALAAFGADSAIELFAATIKR